MDMMTMTTGWKWLQRIQRVKSLFGPAADARSVPVEIERSFPPEIFSASDKATILNHYKHNGNAALSRTSYATARDYCEYADWLSRLVSFHGELKDVQGPWIVKSILTTVPLGGHLVESGGTDSRVAAALA